jgi:DNA repair exonuclease SbcCD ATPase subunit
MSTFFKGAGSRMEKVNNETRQIKSLVDSIYDKFHKEHGLARVKPSAFSVLPYRSEFKRLESEAEAFRDSVAVVVTEQHFVVKKFFITMVSRARDIFNECNRATKGWARAILTPIYTQIQEHKIMIDRRLENLEKIQNNHAVLNDRIKELEAVIDELKKQHEATTTMMARIAQPASTLN